MPLSDLFWLVFRISFLTFGGGATAIPLLQHELVDVQGVISGRDLLTAVAIGRFCPGPNSMYIASLGYMIGGWKGALIAVAAMVLPCFSIIPVQWIYARAKSIRAVQDFATGVSIGATGLIVASVYTLSKGAIIDWWTLGIAITTGAIVVWRRVEPIWVIGAALSVGIVANLIGTSLGLAL